MPNSADPHSDAAPLVTAVITTHQRPELVLRAVASVRAERWERLEIIVAEDGTALRAADFEAPSAPAGPDRPVRLVQATVGGCAAARNLGLAHASGELIIYLDDDDTARPNRIADLVSAIGDAAIAYGRTAKHTPDGGEIAIPAWPNEDGAVDFAGLLVHMPHVDSVLMRTAALRAVGGFDEGAPNFDEFSAWLRMLDRAGSASFRDTVVADWTLHDAGLSGAMVRNSTMGPSLVRLLERVKAFATPHHADLASEIAERLRSTHIDGFADYVAIAEYVRRRHEARGA